MPACLKAKDAREGIKFGKGHNRAGERNAERVLEKARGVLERFGPWVDRYRGGNPRLGVASGILHESRGRILSTSDPVIGESGLMSVTTGLAQKLDVDPFDPEGNIWAGNWLKNSRVLRILNDEEWCWLRDAEPFDFTKLCWKLPGSLGYGGWKIAMRWVFRDPPEAGSDARRKPYSEMLRWIEAHPGRVRKIGRMGPGIVACRIVRHSGTDFLERNGSLSTVGETRLIPRPEHVPRFDEEKYRAVWRVKRLRERERRFPEYLREPEAEEVDAYGVSDAVDYNPHRL